MSNGDNGGRFTRLPPFLSGFFGLRGGARPPAEPGDPPVREPDLIQLDPIGDDTDEGFVGPVPGTGPTVIGGLLQRAAQASSRLVPQSILALIVGTATVDLLIQAEERRLREQLERLDEEERILAEGRAAAERMRQATERLLIPDEEIGTAVERALLRERPDEPIPQEPIFQPLIVEPDPRTTPRVEPFPEVSPTIEPFPEGPRVPVRVQ